MRFAPDTEVTLDFLVVLANTHPAASRTGEDELSTQAQLSTLLREYGFTGRFDRDDQELRDAQETRALLRRIWTLDRDSAAEAVNDLLYDSGARPHLVRHDGFDWHLHGSPPDATLSDRMRSEAAIALVDVIRSDEMGRMRVCEADDCEGILLDLSRNGSKRFCSMRCGNRMNQLAYRARQG